MVVEVVGASVDILRWDETWLSRFVEVLLEGDEDEEDGMVFIYMGGERLPGALSKAMGSLIEADATCFMCNWMDREGW